MADRDPRPGWCGFAGGRAPRDVWADRRSCSTSWHGRISRCTPAPAQVDVALAVHGEHQVSQRAVRGGGGAGMRGRPRAGGRRAGRRRPGLGAPDGRHAPGRRRDRRQRRLQRQPRLDAGRPEGAGLDGPDGPAMRQRRSWAVLGEMAELGEDAITEHDRIGRFAVRLDVSRLIVVGTGRPAERHASGGGHGGIVGCGVRPWSPTPTLRWPCCAPNWRRGDVVLVKASKSVGLCALADTLAGARRKVGGSMRQILFAAGIALAVSILLTPVLIRLFTRQGFGQEIREDGPASHQQEARHPVDGRRRDPGRHLGRLPGHPPGRHRRYNGGGPVGVGPAGARSGHRARRGRVPRRLDQDPRAAQPRAEQDRQDGRAADRGGAVRHAGAAVPQRRRADPGQRAAVLRPRDRHRHAGARWCSCCSAWLLVSAWSNAVNLTDGLDGLAAGSHGDGHCGAT